MAKSSQHPIASLPPARRPGWSLSARVLLLTILFVMLSEVLIYAPSIARFRATWLADKIDQAHLAILALEATPDFMIDPALEAKLLAHVGASAVALRDSEGRNLMLRGSAPIPGIDLTIDLDARTFFGLIADAADCLIAGGDRILRVKGASQRDSASLVDVVLAEAPLRSAMIAYSWRILGLSILISLVTAMLVFAALRWLIIRPMRDLTAAMMRVRLDPEDAPENFGATRRGDEIGLAEREFAEMQSQVRRALKQKGRLAALGTAVGKIQHDLRGILAHARLVADAIGESADPGVRKSVPVLLQAIDRAVALCSDTLNFTRDGPPKPVLAPCALDPLCREIGDRLRVEWGPDRHWALAIPPGLAVLADRGQLDRTLRNLAENAFQMGARTIALIASARGERVEIEIKDDGPGLPPKAIDNLFVPFKGSARAGGTGLGLAIARELTRIQGGELRLEKSDAQGATFLIDLPRADPAPPTEGEIARRPEKPALSPSVTLH